MPSIFTLKGKLLEHLVLVSFPRETMADNVIMPYGAPRNASLSKLFLKEEIVALYFTAR